MRRKSLVWMVAGTLLLLTGGGELWAQRPCTETQNNCPNQTVTTSTIQIGGQGSLSSNGSSLSNPGRLDDGTIAEADLEFTFDRSTGRLTLVARNRTTSTASLTAIGFNTTSDVTGMSLVSETGSLVWELAFDSNRSDNVVDTHPSLKELKMDGFGRFNVFLGNKGISTGGNGGDSREILAGQSVTFVIQVTGTIGNITACSFTSMGSLIPPGDKIVTAVGRFQAGVNGGSGFIGPCTGQDLLVTLSSFDVAAMDSAVLVSWATATEVDHAGFAVLRKDLRTGTTVRLNTTLIPGEGSDISGASYIYEDRTAVNGRKYAYSLEDWDIFGVNYIHRPRVAVPNPPTPSIRLIEPAYEAAAGPKVRMRWESDHRVRAVLEISADAEFASAGTLTLPVGARGERTLTPREIDEVRAMAASGEGGVYWRVRGTPARGEEERSATFFLTVAP